MARAGSKAYWIAYYDSMYGEYMTVKVRDAEEERDYGRVIARSYKKGPVSKAARSANRRSEQSYPNPSKRKVRRRVAKALKKYVRGNAGRFSIRKTKKRLKAQEDKMRGLLPGTGARAIRALKELKKEGKLNPPYVKGRKTKGGRAVTLKNFTGTIVKKSDGTVQIVGRGRRK